MKKAVAALIVGLMSITLITGFAMAGGAKAANSKAPKDPKAIKSIGISLYYQKDEWYVGVHDEFEKQGKARGFQVYLTDADGNSQKQVEQVENLISQQVDLMMIAPVDDYGVISLIDQVRSLDIPVLAYGTQPAGGDYFTFVGWDVYQTGLDLGKEAADYIKTKLGGKANVVILGMPEMENLRLRADGFKAALKGLDVTFVAEEGYEGLRDQAMSKMETILQRNSKIDVVFAAQDPGAFGARSALEAAGVNAKVYACGGYGDEIHDIFVTNDKYIVGDIIVSPYVFVKGIYDALDKYMNGQPLDKVYNIPIEVCTSANYKQIWGE
jgi:ribose transport system substrate-binding protein